MPPAAHDCAMCHSCKSNSGFSFSFAFWIFHWQNQNQNPAIKGFWEVQCPGSQPRNTGKGFSKTVISLRTIRQYPAGIQYPGAELTLLLFSHSPPWVLADRPALSRQEVTRPLTSGQREKLRLLKCTLHQRNSPVRSHYSKAHNQQDEECTLLKESTILKVAAIFSKGVAFSTF